MRIPPKQFPPGPAPAFNTMSVRRSQLLLEDKAFTWQCAAGPAARHPRAGW